MYSRRSIYSVLQKKPQGLMQELFNDFFTSRRENAHHKLFVPFPGGESYYDVYLRILPAVLDLLVTYDDFLIVGHEGVNRIIRGIILGKSLAEMVKLKQGNNEIVSIEISANRENTIKL